KTAPSSSPPTVDPNGFVCSGHYVPRLAENIYEANKKSKEEDRINLKDSWYEQYLFIGNAAIDEEADSAGLVDYAWSHAVISDGLYHRIRRLAT
ncbi:unnamed protein product, partial [Musa hybrid cultivar]